MIALIAVLRSAANISSLIAWSELSTISSVIGSSCAPTSDDDSDVEAVDRARRLLAHEAVAQVGQHKLARAPLRIAEAAAGRGVEADHVSLVHVERGHDGVPLHGSVRADHLGEVRRALAAALERPRQLLVPRVRAREEAAVRAYAVVEDYPLAAAVLALAALGVVQPELLDEESIAGF